MTRTEKTDDTDSEEPNKDSAMERIRTRVSKQDFTGPSKSKMRQRLEKRPRPERQRQGLKIKIV
jgi:hypothetical protein